MSKAKTTTSAEATTAVADVPIVAAERPTALIAGRKFSLIPESQFVALRPDGGLADVMDAMLANGEGDYKLDDLSKAKVPSGGETQWKIVELGKAQLHDEIVGVPVFYDKSGALWPSNESVEGSLPLLVTRDLLHAEQLGDDYGDINPDALEECRMFNDDGTPMLSAAGKPVYDWQKLPYNQFGSGKNGIGKRCKENRLMCILRKDDLFPVFLRVPPTSVNQIAQFFRQLGMKRTPHYAVVVELKLAKKTSKGGQAYSEIEIKLVETLKPEEAAFMKAMYTDSLRAAMQKAAEYQDVVEGGDSEEAAPF